MIDDKPAQIITASAKSCSFQETNTVDTGETKKEKANKRMERKGIRFFFLFCETSYSSVKEHFGFLNVVWFTKNFSKINVITLVG